MTLTKIIAAFTAIITLLFNFFPNSETIAEIYYTIQSSKFAWVETTDTIEEAVEEKDAEALALLASNKLKEKHPTVEQDIQELFDSIKGDILYVEDVTRFGGGIHCDFRFHITTSTDDYQMFIFFTAVGPDESVCGLRRIMMWVKTDEYHSWWTDTENYITEGVIEEAERTLTRSWNCGKGNTADEYIFMVNEDCSRLKGETNVQIVSSRNGGDDAAPESGYAFQEDDVLKVYLIPEGEEPPVPGTREPDAVLTKDNRHPECHIKPGRYYLYVEPSDEYIIYSVSVMTKL